jgi:protein CpxP
MKTRYTALFALAFAGLMASASAQMPDGPPPHGPMGEFGHGPGPELNEAQQQKAFAIRHAAAPQIFEQHTALRKAHDALREMADSGQFDEAKAAAAAAAIGKASAALALAHARVDAQIAALLTPEQRAQGQRHHPRR